MADKKRFPAKLTKPRVDGVLLRTRLFRILDQSRQNLIWVTGPPGSGKTTFVTSFIAARKFRSIWYRVDGSDIDAANLFFHLREAAPAGGSPLPLLTPEYLPSPQSFTRHFFRTLFSRFNSSFVLVFDDYQDLPIGTAFHALLQEGLEEIPERGRIIFISREAPPADFARLQANEFIKVIGWDALQLTLAETRSLMRLKPGKKLSENPITLYNKTGGWAAGVVLLLKSTEGAASQRGLSEDAPLDTIFDYFASEILKRAEPDMQEVLLQTALFPQMTPQMAEALTGNSDAGRLLSKLAYSHSFTVRHGRGREALYRYHDLFRTFLIERARETFSPEHFRNIQIDAAVILEQQGEIDAAVGLQRAAGNIEEIIRLILLQAGSLVAQGRGRTLSAWLKLLPVEVIQQNSWLLYWQGISLLSTNPTQSRSNFAQAFIGFREAHDAAGIWLSWSMAVETFLHAADQLTLLDKWIVHMDDLSREVPFPSRQIEARVASCMLSALLFNQPDHPQLKAWAERAFSLMQKEEELNARLQSGIYILGYCDWIGDFSRGAQVVEILHRDARSPVASPLLRLGYLSSETMFSWLTGSFDRSLEIVSEGLALAEESGIRLYNPILIIHGAAAALCIEDFEKCESMLRQAVSGLSFLPAGYQCVYYYVAAWYALRKSETLLALKHGETAVKLAAEVYTPYLEGICRLILAEIFLERGMSQEADIEAQKAEDIALKMKSRQIEF